MDLMTTSSKEILYNCLFRAYEWLYKEGSSSGNWGEVRSTSLAATCLRLSEPMGGEWLTAAENWLLEQQLEMGEDKASWGEELWDTSMALIFLARAGFSQNDPHFQKAFNWMKSLYNVNGRQNWHDEPWETSWCILAIIEAKIPPQFAEDAYNATKWLLSLQDSDGKIVSPHYTAYFLKICSHLMVTHEHKELFCRAVSSATDYLINAISAKYLWTGEAWSNGQILWALASTKSFPHNNKDILSKVINWFVSNQEIAGNWSDVEDTSSSILGLYCLTQELESIDISNKNAIENLMRNTLINNLKRTQLQIKRKTVETHHDGTISININPKVKKLTAITLAIASTTSMLIKFWDFIAGTIASTTSMLIKYFNILWNY